MASSYAAVDPTVAGASSGPARGGNKLLCARIMGWVCGLNMLLLALDSLNDFVFHPMAPLGALEIVADNADMRMDEGDNATSSLREQVTALRLQVATNRDAIEELRDELDSLQGKGREHEKHDHDGGSGGSGGGKHDHDGGEGKQDKEGADGKPGGGKAGPADAKPGHEDGKGAVLLL